MMLRAQDKKELIDGLSFGRGWEGWVLPRGRSSGLGQKQGPRRKGVWLCRWDGLEQRASAPVCTCLLREVGEWLGHLLTVRALEV